MRMLSLLLITATLCSAAVTPPDQLKVPPGFKVELLREAGPREGSWICMAQDDQGRLYISPQNAIPESGFTEDSKKDSKWGGMWRATLGTMGVEKWERVRVPVGDAMGMLWAFDSLYVSGNGPQGRGIYRCKSSHGDGNLDTATLFKAIPGGAGEHGAHAIVLGPDKKLYIVNGNSTGILDGLAPDSPYRHWGEDDLLPRLKDPVATFFDKIKAPYGCVYRTDAAGTKWELFAGGFRNPYDIAFNADGELFTYDADMEWDRGLPWYRPTRILHVVPGGEYGFREGSAKWPAYFPDSLPAVADIGVGCPTGMKFGTDAKGWPEKYRRALFLHDWTYGRILAVTLHQKGASFTARNDLASYTYPRDAEANGDVEVFLSGKGMPVTDMEFLRDGSMVFTVGGRGTAAALYRVSYVGKKVSTLKESQERLAKLNKEAALQDRLAKLLPLLEQEKSAQASAPEAQRNVAGGAASEASATTGSPSAKASAPDGVPEDEFKNALERDFRRQLEGDQSAPGLIRMVDKAQAIDDRDLFIYSAARNFVERLPQDKLRALAVSEPQPDTRSVFLNGPVIFFEPWTEEKVKEPARARAQDGLMGLLALARAGDATTQADVLQTLGKYPFAPLSDDLKLLKLRILELSFARQGRPSEERVKAVMEELLAHYPVPPFPANAATAGGAGAPRPLPKADDKQAPAERAAERAFHPGAPVDAPAWRLNRELCALLVWLSNPELGELNANLVGKPAGKASESPKAPAPGPSGGKSGSFQRKDGFPAEFASVSSEKPQSDAIKAHAFTANTHAFTSKADAFEKKAHAFDENAHASEIKAHAFDVTAHASSIKAHAFIREADAFVINTHAFSTKADAFSVNADAFPEKACAFTANTHAFEASAPSDGQSASSVSQSAPSKGASDPAFAPAGSAFAASAPLFAQAAPAAAKADTLPSEAPPVNPGSRPASLNSGLGPVPNPGADIFPGRKGAAFHAELGRQVIEKTLALMEGAGAQESGGRGQESGKTPASGLTPDSRLLTPSQEEQIWYALCLRWAHGWTPEQRVRYFRWFHEKAARYSGGNSFAKFVEAIRADAASRVPESDRAALAEWMHPVASPPPAVLKPRDFVKAWTLPELEAALDKLKDRKPDLARGKDLYTQAQCAQCHLFRDAGGNVGPDLTAVAQRFGRHDILESITDPSKVIGDQYAMITLTILDGKGGTSELSGLVKEESSATITLLTDPLAGKTANLYKNVIVKREKSPVSIMPPGLLYTLTAEEVADLVGFLGAK